MSSAATSGHRVRLVSPRGVAKSRAFIAAIGLSLAALAGAAEPSRIAAIEKAASDWVKVRAEAVRIESEWEAEQALMATTVEGLKERAALLEDRRDHLRASTTEARSELSALGEKKSAGAAELATAEERLKNVDRRLLELREKLPPRLGAALEFSFKSLDEGDLSPGERMQLTMSVLNRCAQFNGAVSCGEEVLEFEGENAARAVETIYWGLSHGYALDRASGRVWLGSAGAGRWSWTPAPDAAEAVGRLIAIYNDQRDPELVMVPARLAGAGQR